MSWYANISYRGGGGLIGPGTRGRLALATPALLDPSFEKGTRSTTAGGVSSPGEKVAAREAEA